MELNWVDTSFQGATLVVAFLAAFTWRRHLKYQRGDELLRAAVNVQGAVNRALASMEYGTSRETFGDRLDAAYATAREFICCRYVAERYYYSALKGVPDINDDSIMALIDSVRDIGR